MDYTPKIRKEDLINGEYYLGECRNATVARWEAKTKKFKYWRTKFGHTFLEEICCPEDEKHFDVFIAERILGEEEIHKNIPIDL